MTRQGMKVLAVAVAFGIVGTNAAEASQGTSNHMIVTGRTTQPIGHYEYCKVFGEDCSLRARNGKPMALSRARWQQLVETNERVNRGIRPATDLDLFGVEELWTYPEEYGDCEDYVLLKRHMLMQLGWPASTLLVTVVRQRNGDGHAVLTVRTDRADYVLDNLEDGILPWNETEYHFLKRQSAEHSGRWEGIDDSRSSIVGSVK